MDEVLTWVYLINAIILVNHEIDSAYWKEWDLFKLPGGVNGFLALHFPLLLIVMYGLIQVHESTITGHVISLLVGLSGVFAFAIHTYFIKKGRNEFKTSMSLSILWATLIVSTVQVAITVHQLLKGNTT